MQVLGCAREMGMLKLGTVSLDGTKLHANASRHSAVMSYGHAKKLEAKLKAEVAELMRRAEAANAKDLPEGMNLPEELSRRQERLAAIAAAKTKIEARVKAEAEAAYAAKLAAREQRAKKNGKRPGGRPPAPPSGTPKDTDQVNFTDEDSLIMPGARGWLREAYNAQAAVDTDSMLVVASALTQATNDKQQVVPMLEQLQPCRPIWAGSSGCWPIPGMPARTTSMPGAQAKIQPLIALGREAHHGSPFDRFAEPAPLPSRPTPLTAMRHRLQTRRGRKWYALRKCTVEPVFGLIKHVMKFRQFLLRGINAPRRERSLLCLAWNMKRMNALGA